MVVACLLSGLLLPKTPLISPWYFGGSAIVLIGSALMCKASMCIKPGVVQQLLTKPCLDTVSETTSNEKIYGYSILIGAGAGCYVVIGFTVVQSLVPARDIANAVAAMTIG